MKIFWENESVDLYLVMFSENGKRPILTEFRGCFPHAVDELMIMGAIIEIWIHFVYNETIYLKNNMIKNVNIIISIAYK